MKCVLCRNGETRRGKTTVTLERGDAVVVIKGIPAKVCENCGEPYLTEVISARVTAMAKEAVHKGTEVAILRYIA